MIRRVVTKVFVISLVPLFAGCAPKKQTSDSPGKYSEANKKVSCIDTLKLANQKLIQAKKNTKREGIYVDWARANNWLAAAVAAQNQGNYDTCVTKANSVNLFTIRNQNYISWQNSLK